VTTSNGDLPVGETVDIEAALQEVTADDAPEMASAEPVADEAAEAPAAPEEPAEPEEVDPAAALKADLRSKPGDWYVIHSYAGYENKVKANLETRVQNLDVGDYIFQVEVPTEEVTEIKNGQRKQVNRKVLPGYILVRMDLTDDSWSAVRNTPGVTGFVGATSRPSALMLDDVVKFLLPQGAAKKPVKGAASTASAGVELERPVIEVDYAVGESVTVMDGPFDDQRGQRRTTETQGAGVHLRPRNTRRTGLHPGLQDLVRRPATMRATQWPEEKQGNGKEHEHSWPRKRRSSG
jgi:transcriptional antiterminator NusG